MGDYVLDDMGFRQASSHRPSDGECVQHKMR